MTEIEIPVAAIEAGAEAYWESERYTDFEPAWEELCQTDGDTPEVYRRHSRCVLAAALPHLNSKATVCICRTVALSGWDTVQQVVDPRCPIHSEPTFTASEVKELTTTATAVALALGRKEALEEVAAAIIAHRDADDSTREFRLGLSIGAKFARDMASQPYHPASNGLTAGPASPSTPEESVPAESAFPRGFDCYKLPRAADGVLRHHANCVIQPDLPPTPEAARNSKEKP